MDEQTARDITNTLSSYIEQRDTMSLRAKGSAFSAGSGIGIGALSHFANMTDAHAKRLAELLPTMNLAETQAFSELMNSRLNDMRMKEIG